MMAVVALAPAALVACGTSPRAERPIVGPPGERWSYNGGATALLGMLNSCSPNVTVVNIDNGFGAAYTAVLIARASSRTGI